MALTLVQSFFLRSWYQDAALRFQFEAVRKNYCPNLWPYMFKSAMLNLDYSFHCIGMLNSLKKNQTSYINCTYLVFYYLSEWVSIEAGRCSGSRSKPWLGRPFPNFQKSNDTLKFAQIVLSNLDVVVDLGINNHNDCEWEEELDQEWEHRVARTRRSQLQSGANKKFWQKKGKNA